MRYIKYRVFDHNLKMMFEVTELKQMGGGIPFIKGEKGDKGGERYVTGGYANKKTIVNGKQDFRFKLMQYTGLKDNNGNEIYEGDVFHLGDVNIKYIVEWIDTGLKGRQSTNSSYVGLKHWQERVEVTGNIYENPELIS